MNKWLSLSKTLLKDRNPQVIKVKIDIKKIE